MKKNYLWAIFSDKKYLNIYIMTGLIWTINISPIQSFKYWGLSLYFLFIFKTLFLCSHERPLCIFIIFLQLAWFCSLEFPNFLWTAEQAEDFNWIYHFIFFLVRTFLLKATHVDDIDVNQLASVLLKDSARSPINHL